MSYWLSVPARDEQAAFSRGESQDKSSSLVLLDRSTWDFFQILKGVVVLSAALRNWWDKIS